MVDKRQNLTVWWHFNSFTVQAAISQFMPLYSDSSRVNFLIFGMLVTALLPALACLK
jgi:hypothetical protein